MRLWTDQGAEVHLYPLHPIQNLRKQTSISIGRRELFSP